MLIAKKKFAIVVLNPKYKTFIVHIAALSVNLNDKMDFLKKAQITHLKINGVFIKVFSKYVKFADIFLLKLVAKLPNYIIINDYVIKLVDD